ncbi:hypothetical protein DMUE_5528 [Dictyocoela muelleri]|nr:hypothetical protein DMUE_5528 [Dictyocoela muelleri]
MRLNNNEVVTFIMSHQFIRSELTCLNCLCFMKLCTYKANVDQIAFRCMHKGCSRYKGYTSVRKGSFFDGFNIDMGLVLRIVIRYFSKSPMHSIIEFFGIGTTVKKVIIKLNALIPLPNFQNNKLGGPGFIVQIDETMMNYSCKSHRGRPASNITDALCIVEVRNGIIQAYAQTIPDKNSSTIIPIICRQVASNS